MIDPLGPRVGGGAGGRATVEGDPGGRPWTGDPGRETVWATVYIYRPCRETLEGDPGRETLLGPTYGVKPWGAGALGNRKLSGAGALGNRKFRDEPSQA